MKFHVGFLIVAWRVAGAGYPAEVNGVCLLQLRSGEATEEAGAGALRSADTDRVGLPEEARRVLEDGYPGPDTETEGGEVGLQHWITAFQARPEGSTLATPV